MFFFITWYLSTKDTEHPDSCCKPFMHNKQYATDTVHFLEFC